MTTWDGHFLAMAALVATRSKDQGTKVGAIVTTDDHVVLGTGFNGFPRGAPDDRLPVVGRAKHVWTVHAEVNAMLTALTASRPGRRLEDCRLYSTHRPCSRCLLLAYHLGVRWIAFDVDELSAEQRVEAELVESTLELRPHHGSIES